MIVLATFQLFGILPPMAYRKQEKCRYSRTETDPMARPATQFDKRHAQSRILTSTATTDKVLTDETGPVRLSYHHIDNNIKLSYRFRRLKRSSAWGTSASPPAPAPSRYIAQQPVTARRQPCNARCFRLRSVTCVPIDTILVR